MNILNFILLAGRQQGQGGGGMSGIVMLLLIIAIFYFFMIRPQSKRQKEEKKFREQLTKGQEVVTISGVHGKIKDVKDATIMLEIAHDVVIEVEKSSIALGAVNPNTSSNNK